MNLSRRNFLLKSGVGAVTLASIPAIVSSCLPSGGENPKARYGLIREGDTLLFQGDSITDAGREKQNELPNHAASFGRGYAFLAASALLGQLPEKQLTIYNRGISGNKVYQLAERWPKDAFDLKPDILSILIGVNDYWHTRNRNYDGTVEGYENDYRDLLTRTKQELPNVTLVVCEPFYVLEASAVDQSWVEPMKQYQAAAKRISDEFNTQWVPFQKVFDEAVKHAPATYWTADGVHPAMPGAELMAQTWLQALS